MLKVQFNAIMIHVYSSLNLFMDILLSGCCTYKYHVMSMQDRRILCVKWSQTEIEERRMKIHGLMIWNLLPQNIGDIINFNVFKNKLKEYYKDNQVLWYMMKIVTNVSPSVIIYVLWPFIMHQVLCVCKKTTVVKIKMYFEL